MLKHKLNVQVLGFKSEEVRLIVLQVHGNELEATRIDVDLAATLVFLKLLLTVVQEAHQQLHQVHFPVNVLSQGRELV